MHQLDACGISVYDSGATLGKPLHCVAPASVPPPKGSRTLPRQERRPGEGAQRDRSESLASGNAPGVGRADCEALPGQLLRTPSTRSAIMSGPSWSRRRRRGEVLAARARRAGGGRQRSRRVAMIFSPRLRPHLPLRCWLLCASHEFTEPHDHFPSLLNHADAAVTTALCLGVLHPASSGIGGGAFILIYNATTKCGKSTPSGASSAIPRLSPARLA